MLASAQVLKHDDWLIIRVDDHDKAKAIADSMGMMELRGMVVASEFSLEVLDEEQMRLAGWVRAKGDRKSILERGEEWLLNGRTGLSSKAIYCHMTGRAPEDGYYYPRDPGDLNRCLMLLDLFPEWAERIGEMAKHNKQWDALATNWPEITGCFFDEVGLNWAHGKRAPKTYALMRMFMGEEE